jgi:hypothetical protein
MNTVGCEDGCSASIDGRSVGPLGTNPTLMLGCSFLKLCDGARVSDGESVNTEVG